MRTVSVIIAPLFLCFSSFGGSLSAWSWFSNWRRCGFWLVLAELRRVTQLALLGFTKRYPLRQFDAFGFQESGSAQRRLSAMLKVKGGFFFVDDDGLGVWVVAA